MSFKTAVATLALLCLLSGGGGPPTLAQAAPDPLQTGLVAHFRLDGTAEDSVRVGSPGVVTGSETYEAGRIGQALRNDGASTSVAAPAINPTGSITVSAWVRAEPGIDLGTILMERSAIGDYYCDGASSATFGLQIFEGRFAFEAATGDAGQCTHRFRIFDTRPPTPGVFHLIAGTIDVAARQMRLFVDGTLVATAATGSRIMLQDDSVFRIGRNHGYVHQPWVGLIDDVRVYDRALSEEDVRALFLRGQAPTAHFSFDGHTSDVTGHGYDVTADGSVSYAQGRFDGAVQLDSADDNAVGPAIPTPGSRTVAAWVQRSQEPGWYPETILVERSASSDYGCLGDRSSFGTFQLQVYEGRFLLGAGTGSVSTPITVNGYFIENCTSRPLISGPDVVQPGRFYFVVGVFDHLHKELRLYQDGVLVASAPAGDVLIVQPASVTRIGRSFYSVHQPWFGLIDDLRVYDRALSTAEVEALFREGIPNHPPVADPGHDQSLPVGSSVGLNAGGSTDLDGDYPLTYRWTIVRKPAMSRATLSDPDAVAPSFTADAPGDYVLHLTVTDSKGTSATARLVVSTVNAPPVADAGADQAVVFIRSTVELDGTRSYDPDGQPLQYLWRFLSRPLGSAAELREPTSATPTFVADVHGAYECELTVHDSWAPSVPDRVVVSFDNVRPVAIPSGDEAAVVGDVVRLSGATSVNANGDPLSYFWRLVSAPTGSEVALQDAERTQTILIPDTPGEYVVSLVVGDGFSESDPVNVQVMVVSLQTAEIGVLRQLIQFLNQLDPQLDYRNTGHRSALTHKLTAVIEDISNEDYRAALNKLSNDVLRKTDGCAASGAPDNNDFIVDCAAQALVLRYVSEVVALLGRSGTTG